MTKPLKLMTKDDKSIINIVCGPPCAGKSTFIQDVRLDSDLVIDYDLIARALGSINNYQATGEIKNASLLCREFLIEHALGGLDVGAWIVHSNPSIEAVERYKEKAVTFYLIDPGKAECLRRCEQDNRPEETAKLIEQWYDDPPQLEQPMDPNKAVFQLKLRKALSNI